MSDLSNRIAELSPEKRALLLQRLNQKKDNAASTEITRQSRESNAFPLSFAQQRLWFFDQLEPGNPTYNICSVGRLKGNLNAIALEQTFNEIVKRHEVLRTTFTTADGQPVQVIAPSLKLSLPVIDLRSLPETKREQEVQRLAEEEAQRPFDLKQGPLLRVSLLHISESEYVLILVIHHIISDGWSMRIMIQELAALYQAFSSKTTLSLPEINIQYADFAVWQRSQGKELETQLEYWKKQLGGDLPILNLPSDRPRPAVQTFRGAVHRFALPQTLTKAIAALSQRHGGTLFMALLAAFNILLYRYTGQEDILVGSPIANRNRKEIEGLIGLFANTLVFRTDLSQNPTFIELLARVRQVALGAYSHQDLPFEKLVEVLQPDRDLSRNPVFQVLCALRNIKMPTLELPEVTLIPQEMERQTARFDLALDFWEEAEAISGVFEYNTDLFDASTIERIAGHYQTLLESILSNPNERISTLRLLTKTERQQLLVEWNNTQTDYRQNKCLHQLFEEQVNNNPDAIAVVFENKKITYQELDGRANKLARYLQKIGVKPEVMVGVCLERSIEMIVGLLGIIKAGGAYVPLDPAYANERLTFMLEDAKVPVLLTETHLSKKVPTSDLRTVYLDSDWDKISQESAENPAIEVIDTNLAYVIYTSGSTGKPKGVQVTHHSVVHLFETTRPIFNFERDDVWTVFHSYAFDLSVWEIWGALVNGCKLVVVPLFFTQSPHAFYELLCQEKVTVLNQTPSAIRQLIQVKEASDRSQNLSLRLIICGGEAFPSELAHQLLEWNVPIWNFYGPTEATVWAAIHPVKSLESNNGFISIGRPLFNTQIYILDANLQPVPVGFFGELHIGGTVLSRGYLNRPELTAEKFISNCFSQEIGTRLYKTGDLARYLPSGRIEFIGRIDQQVKIRGFRIELGEIEAVLIQHPEVKQAVAIVREDNPGDKRLVAYIVPAGKTLQPTSVRQFLKEKLPDYMIPSALVMLEAIPLTTNGKIDRRALPAPDSNRPQLNSNFVAPSTSIEENIATIWNGVLGIQKIGIHDNFFELGGHSLLAIQVVSRLREAFQIELPLRCLFESPTIAGLSEQIENYSTQKIDAPPIQRISRKGELPLSFAQERLWFLDRLKPGDSAYNIPSAVRLKGALNVAALEQSLNEIIRRHEVLRSHFDNLKPIQIVNENFAFNLPVVDLRELPESEREQKVQHLALQEAKSPFDLARSPLLRVTLLQLNETDYVVLFTMHHIISDRWSMGVLIQELAALYEAFCAGKSSPLPELAIQYADFAVWQRNWLQGEVLEKQLNYWKQQLGGKLPVLNFPDAKPPQSVATLQSASQSFVIKPELADAIATLSRQENATLFMTLLAAFKTLLHRYTGADDIAIGTDVANRNRAEIEPLIGFFINILVLRSDLRGNPTFRQLLRQVREKALGAYAHQDLPFGKLVEFLQPERKVSQTPLFQVLFVFQNAPVSNLELPGLTLTPLEVENTNSKFDLVLFVEESQDGIVCTWKYNTDLFVSTTITSISKYFETLLSSIVAQPDARLNTLEILTESERMAQIEEQKQREEANRKKFKFVKPKAVSFPQNQLIKTVYLQPGETLPLVIQPNVEDIDLVDWAKNNGEFIDTQLLKHGGILFRGFNTKSVSDFENFAQVICSELFGEYGDLPREGVGGKVYGSTPYPADKAILFHSESSHMHRWPMKIWFFCVQPAKEGGETPIVDCRKIYQLLAPKIRERFAQKQLMYVRNYTEGLDVNWQDFFRTTDKAAVETYCRQNGIEFEWQPNNGLKTKEIRQAVAQHPKTGEWVFFNQIQLHHIAYLEESVRESLFSLFGEEHLPRNVYYGDGTAIEKSIIDEINAVYEQAKIEFPWQQGDIIMLDNMMTAHGRNPYVGPRKIVVAMGEIVNNKIIQSRGV